MNKQRKGLNQGILDNYLPPKDVVVEKKVIDLESMKEETTKIRQTFYVDTQVLEKIKDAAWNDRVTVTEVVNEALVNWLMKQEERRGSPYPSRAGGVKKGRPVK